MKKSLQAGFHLWIIIVIIVFVGVVGLLVWTFVKNGGVSKLTQQTTSNYSASLPCKERDVTFTSPPMRMEDLGYIRPLGSMLDGHVTPVDHVYVGPVKVDVPDNTFPVLMPADGTVVEVSRMPAEYVGDRDFQAPPDDHRMVISFNCRYSSIYIHIHKLADPIASAAGEMKPSENKSISVELKAGDIVGYIGGSTFDWTPIDGEKTLTGFISPELYKGESWKMNTVSPFDLYTGDLKAQMEAKSWRTVAPIGGKIDYDQAGKLIGTWFREGTNGYSGSNQERYWDGHLSIVPDYIDPAYNIFSTGNWEDKALQLLIKADINLADIDTATGQVKLELQRFDYVTEDNDTSWSGNSLGKGIHPEATGDIVGTVLVQVLDGEKLKVEKFVGKTASQVSGFTSAAQIYER